MAGIDNLVDGYTKGSVSRRQFIRGGLALGLSLGSLVAVLEACTSGSTPSASTAGSSPAPSQPAASSAGAGGELDVLGWGGNYGDALAEFVTAPYEAATGATVVFQEQANASDSLAKLQAEQANPTVDVWLTTSALPLLLAKAGGLQELTVAQVPNLADIIPLAVQSYEGKMYGAGIHLGANLIIVDKDRIKQLIPDYDASMLKSWKFLYRPELRGQISVPGFQGQYGSHMIGASLPFGGSENDEEKFFAAMKQLAPNVHVVPPSGIGITQLFLSKEIVAALGNGSIVSELTTNGASIDVAYPVDPLVVSLDYIVALKDGPAGPDLALQYVNQILDPNVMKDYATQLGAYSPNTKASQPPLPGLPDLSPDEIVKNGRLIDYEVAIKNFDAWLERYTKEIVPLYGG